jgi:hypothetical protein
MAHPNFLRMSAFCTLFLIPVALFSQPSDTIPASIPDEIFNDWKKQDGVGSDYAAAITKIKSSLPEAYASKITGTSSKADYLTACHWRRVAKLKPHMGNVKKVLYAKHYNMGDGIVGYLSGLPNDQGRNWAVGSGLYILNMTNYYPKPEVLLEDASGVIKDPCVSFDGKKVVFAWTKNSDGGGFHIFEIDVATKETRQITKNPLDLKVGDYEPCYMPTGDIMFSSTRSYGMVNCAYNTVGNMFLCNKNGDWLRTIGFDQEATFTPTMMSDGKVLFSRWEYNDRTRISVSGYFAMNPDGSHQTEYWGNQSDFPLMKYHAREIPNSGGKIMGIAGDHLAPYQGELIVIDPIISRNNFKGEENESIKLIAPVRKVPVDPSTEMSGNSGGAIKYIFQNPWPFDENNCLVSWTPAESEKIFKIYFFNADASRELMAWDSKMSVCQPMVMDERAALPVISMKADYTKETGVFSVTNAYYGAGSKGIPEGKIVKLRVIALDYRTNYSNSSGVLGFSVNPIGATYTDWLVKTLLGEIPVEKDGSACFTVPANTPIYFQTVDADGRMVNTMRSWATLMPGERFDCTGCHENKNESPLPVKPIAISPKPLVKRLGVEDKGFSFPKMVQPILDKYCISCHNASHKSLDLRANPALNSAGKKTFNSSYSNLAKTQGKYIDWITQKEKAAPRTKFPVPGSGTSPLADRLLKGHNTDKNKITPEEREVLFCWMDFMAPHGGSYWEGMAAADSTKYVTYLNGHRNKHLEWEKSNCKAFVEAGQWNNAIYQGGSNVPARYSNEQKARKDAGELRVIPFAGRLAVQCPGTGMISILDMKGRVLKNVNANDAMKNGKQQVFVQWTMPSGIYVVKFKGKDIVRQRVVASLTDR